MCRRDFLSAEILQDISAKIVHIFHPWRPSNAWKMCLTWHQIQQNVSLLNVSQTVTSANSTCFWRGAVRILSVTTARTVEREQRERSRVGNDGRGWKTSTWNWQKRLLLLLLGILTFLHTKGQHDVKLPHQCGDRVIHCTEFTSQVWFFSF